MLSLSILGLNTVLGHDRRTKKDIKTRSESPYTVHAPFGAYGRDANFIGVLVILLLIRDISYVVFRI